MEVLAHRDLAAQEREAALRRVVDFYLHTAHTADRLVHLHRVDIRLAPPMPGCTPNPLPDGAAAMAWFDIEHPCLRDAQHTAATLRWWRAVWQLDRTEDAQRLQKQLDTLERPDDFPPAGP